MVLASFNPHKLRELGRILAVALPAVEVVGLDSLPSFEPAPETGTTFVENALAKAREAAIRTGVLAIADDSGLCVDALNGMPGVLSARWAGVHGDDAANVRLVLGQVTDVPDGRRGAAFVCAAAAVTPQGRELVAEGRVEGVLTREPRGEHGFGYDPIFVPLGFDQTSAELSAEDKDAISHRGHALRALAAGLPDLF